MAHTALRHPVYPFGDAGEPFTAHGFADAVETENLPAAEGMVQRGLADGLHWPDVHADLAAAALAHYNDFGHSLIYVYKSAQLIEHLGTEVEPFLLPTLARHLCYTTREDLLPDFRDYASALAALQADTWGKSPACESLPYPATTKQALAWLVRNAASHTPEALYQALLEALARNFLYYDATYDTQFHRPVSDNVSWAELHARHHLCQRRADAMRRGAGVVGARPVADGLLRGAQSPLCGPGTCTNGEGMGRRRPRRLFLGRLRNCFWTTACANRYSPPTSSRQPGPCRKNYPAVPTRAASTCSPA